MKMVRGGQGRGGAEEDGGGRRECRLTLVNVNELRAAEEAVGRACCLGAGNEGDGGEEDVAKLGHFDAWFVVD